MYLVTGGAGFIGSHLIRRLLDEGHDVRVIDNLQTGDLAKLPLQNSRLEFLDADIRNVDAVESALKGVQAVFHLAAEVSVPRSIADPKTTYEVNVTGFLNVLLAARADGCDRVVFASSSAVYGDDPEMPKRETMAAAPISPYASSKLAGEDLCRVFEIAYELETVCLRFFNVYGPRQDPNSAYAAVVPKFIDAISKGIAPLVFGDGEQTRDFVFVESVVDALIRAATVPAAAGMTFNVASGSTVTLNQTLEILERVSGRPVNATYQPERAGDIRHSSADISLAERVLGFRQICDFEEGLRRTYDAVMPTLNVTPSH